MPGEHTFLISYEKTEASESPERLEGYAGAYLGNDTQTQGKWKTKYGSEGYYLFAFDQSTNPVDSLPSFVSSFAFNTASGVGNPQFINYPNVASDPRALQNPSATGSSALGVVATRDPSACFQTIRIDIGLSKPTNYMLSIYVVDFDLQQREMVVEVYDGQTKNIIAPYQFVTNFQNGIYLKYSYNQSVEVRLSQVRGGDAVVSGLFFDV